MDLNDIWQENKRFIVTVGSGLLVLLIGVMVIDGMYVGDIGQYKRERGKAQRELGKELYSVDDRELAEAENEALRGRYERIAGAIAFQPRPAFRLEGASVSAQNVYATAAEGVRQRVGDLASRRRAFLPDGLGLKLVKTTNVDAIERNLHALDLLERALVLALDSGVRQVRSIDVRLDPAFTRRRGLGPIERTLVDIEVTAKPEAVTRWIVQAETPAGDDVSQSENEATAVRAQALPVLAFDVLSQKSKDGEVRAKVTFLVIRIHEIQPDDEDA